MKVIAATKNKGKIREMHEILSPLDIEIISQQEMGIELDVEETGDTFVKNALIKARAVAMVCDYPVLADDSGICVDALDGAPGVRSARYAGDNATDEEKINKMLGEIGDAKNRNAKFVTAVAFIFPDGREVTAE
ncbi:MAG: non-canonical purine NTP pyrophosphatase, partial [Clostridia bacterium]|nr:non-canonical purine NTP pyrophosphatase [Clostridia bacterium]